jgi:hypothetical protein
MEGSPGFGSTLQPARLCRHSGSMKCLLTGTVKDFLKIASAMVLLPALLSFRLGDSSPKLPLASLNEFTTSRPK